MSDYYEQYTDLNTVYRSGAVSQHTKIGPEIPSILEGDYDDDPFSGNGAALVDDSTYDLAEL